MSKANRPTKVLRTALKRLQRGWTKGTFYSGPGDGDGSVWKKNTNTAIPKVCLLGAIHGYQGQVETPCSIIAEKSVLEAINELFPNDVHRGAGTMWSSVMNFNDHQDTTFEMVEEVVKLGLIKLETGWEPLPKKSTGRL